MCLLLIASAHQSYSPSLSLINQDECLRAWLPHDVGLSWKTLCVLLCFERGIPQSPVESTDKGSALWSFDAFSLNNINSRDVGDNRFHVAHVMIALCCLKSSVCVHDRPYQSRQLTLFHAFMMTSSNGNIFRVTGPLYGEFTGHWWIPLTKTSNAELWCFL